jgi:hypothetical protein
MNNTRKIATTGACALLLGVALAPPLTPLQTLPTAPRP